MEDVDVAEALVFLTLGSLFCDEDEAWMSEELARETAADGLCVAGRADLVVVLLIGARMELLCELEVETEGAREDLGPVCAMKV